MSSISTPSLTSASSASRSPSPGIPVQPDHFYRATEDPAPIPNVHGWFNPEDDLLATRGIPVFKPTMDEFRDFEDYMNKIECWGMKSGIVKVIPPKEWTDSLPPMKDQLKDVKIVTPIEQQVHGTGGHFRQENMEKRKLMSVREWVDLCAKDDYRAPGVSEVGLRSGGKMRLQKKTRTAKSGGTDAIGAEDSDSDAPRNQKPRKGRLSREQQVAAKQARDTAFLQNFQPHLDWLPPGTIPEDYSPKFCEDLARQFWRNCGIGKAAWYGADSQGSLFTDETTEWNVAHLESALTRLLPSSDQGLPGVNTPYLYWGMWRATFAWHVEDMDLFSINYIHFGAPKFWYAIPQGRASAFEQTMKGLFPTDGKRCSQFLRHKQFLVSPSKLAKDFCAPNHCVQQAGEFIITYPRGYHAGFNMGLNCAESVNFALNSWIPLGREAKACECVSDSVRIDVDQLMRDRLAERGEYPMDMDLAVASGLEDSTSNPSFALNIPPRPKKRFRAEDGVRSAPKKKRKQSLAGHSSTSHPSMSMAIKPPKSIGTPKLTLKLGPRPRNERPGHPCCLCASIETDGLLPVMNPPFGRKEAVDAAEDPSVWMAHRGCADVVPETWVDEIDLEDGTTREVVCGVEWIVKDRWNLKCSACLVRRDKARGAPIQCTKGKCAKAFHVSCAKNGAHLGIVYTQVRETENEVVLNDPAGMHVDVSADPQPGKTVKVIKKVEVELFCAQHNPDLAAAKRVSKAEQIRTHLMDLPPSSLIKIRTSSGLFQVTLVKVIPEQEAVEVIWNRNSKGELVHRQYKWNGVILDDGADSSHPQPQPYHNSMAEPVMSPPGLMGPSSGSYTTPSYNSPPSHAPPMSITSGSRPIVPAALPAPLPPSSTTPCLPYTPSLDTKAPVAGPSTTPPSIVYAYQPGVTQMPIAISSHLLRPPSTAQQPPSAPPPIQEDHTNTTRSYDSGWHARGAVHGYNPSSSPQSKYYREDIPPPTPRYHQHQWDSRTPSNPTPNNHYKEQEKVDWGKAGSN